MLENPVFTIMRRVKSRKSYYCSARALSYIWVVMRAQILHRYVLVGRRLPSRTQENPNQKALKHLRINDNSEFRPTVLMNREQLDRKFHTLNIPTIFGIKVGQFR